MKRILVALIAAGGLLCGMIGCGKKDDEKQPQLVNPPDPKLKVASPGDPNGKGKKGGNSPTVGID